VDLPTHMPYEEIKQRLALMKEKWDKKTGNYNAALESMTSDDKKQCLEELEDVCKYLCGLKEALVKDLKAEQEAEAKAEILKVVESKKAKLKQNYLEIKGMCGVFQKYGPYSLYGYFPEFWVDMHEHLVKIEDAKKQLDELEAELKKFDPSGTCLFERGGGFVVADPIIPPPTDFLMELLGFSRDENEYKSRVKSSINQVASKICEKRKHLHHLLTGYKPVNMKILQPRLDTLNKEREELIYSLRVLECQGHFSGFNPVLE
jgi:hypothetical protein